MNARVTAKVVGVGLIVVLGWFATHKPAPAAVNQPQEAKKAPEVASMPTETITPKQGVVVYAAPAKKALALPKAVQDDPGMVVVGSSEIPDSDHPQTITTVLNANTGQSQTFVTVDPYPWLAGENAREVRVSYGMKNMGRFVARAAFSDDLFQIKALHFGVNASLDSDGQYFAGIGVAYRW